MTECPICYEAITAETGITTLSCSHSFHLQCVATWLIQVNNCPCCRGEVTQYEDIQDLIPSLTEEYNDEDEDLTAMLDDMTQTFTDDTSWIMMRSGNWVVNTPVPDLQLPDLQLPDLQLPDLHLPPQIQRRPFVWNIHAEPYIPDSS